jgi:hypothetical protein
VLEDKDTTQRRIRQVPDSSSTHQEKDAMLDKFPPEAVQVFFVPHQLIATSVHYLN